MSVEDVVVSVVVVVEDVVVSVVIVVVVAVT